MRPGTVFTGALDAPTGTSPAPSRSVMSDGTGPHAVWHSPVPYLFGGLAAMLGMIVLALLVLACSYWRLSSYLDHTVGSNGEQNRDDGEKCLDDGDVKMVELKREHVVVIMAGDEKPTFLATRVNEKDEIGGS